MDSPLTNHFVIISLINRIVSIRSLVTLYVKPNAEKVNYQSDTGSLTVEAGESRKTTRNYLLHAC